MATASLQAFRQAGDAAALRQQTFIVIDHANGLLSALTDAETGERGYALTGDEAFLEPYLAVREAIAGQLQELRQLASARASHAHLDAITSLADAKLVEVAQVINLRRTHDLPAVVAAVSGGHGRRLMDSIRAEMRSFMALENAALAQRDAGFDANMRWLFAVIVASGVLTLLLAMAFVFLFHRETRHRLKALVHLQTRHLLDAQTEINQQLQHANLSLLESEERLAVTLNSIGDAVIATDAEGRVTRLNPLGERLTGWTQQEASGRPAVDIFHIVNKDTRQPGTIPLLDTLAHGTTQGLANHTVLIARDGSERDIADSCAPIRDRDGHVIGAVLVFRDVTTEYATQQALGDSAALIQTILDTVADSIITIHAQGSIVARANAAAEKMFGYAAAELIGKKFGVLIPELDRGERNGLLEHYDASDEARALGLGREVSGRRQDGSTFPIEIAMAEMWQGGERYLTAILRDVSARQRVEAERMLLDEALHEKNAELEKTKSTAERANLAKSDFLSNMSHELRTPLSAILGFAQLMDSASPPPSVLQKRSIHQILQAGWYLLELINEILDLAQIESGRVSLSLETVALAEVMGECRALIEPQARKRDINISFCTLDTPSFVKVDRTRLKQVLINLLSNAVKYNRAGGAVIVDRVAHAPGRVRIEVTDTGEGLAADQLAQLFQPFNRLGQEANVVEGTGIGLVVAKRLIESMDGVIGVESTVGKGSVFWIEMNLAPAPQVSAHAVIAADGVRAQAASAAQLRTLLYVEDNPANVMLVEDLIARRSDLHLLIARDGNRGVNMARAALPDVILMDINLPGISGVDALRILTADPATAHIPIIALSANAVPRDIAKGLEAGFFRYLTKPIKVVEFMDTLDLALIFAKTQSARIGGESTA